MDCPYCPDVRHPTSPPRAPLSLWAPIALIAVVLGAAALASALSTDTREFGDRPGMARVQGRAL